MDKYVSILNVLLFVWKFKSVIREGAVPYSFLNDLKTFISVLFDVLSPKMYNGISKKKKFFICFEITGTVTFNFFYPVIWIFTLFKAEL